MKAHYGELRPSCDEPVCPDPVWKLSKMRGSVLVTLIMIIIIINSNDSNSDRNIIMILTLGRPVRFAVLPFYRFGVVLVLVCFPLPFCYFSHRSVSKFRFSVSKAALRSVSQSSCLRCSSRPWGFEFLRAYIS